MSYDVIIEHKAALDIQFAFEWYEDAQAGLGLEFIEEIDDAFNRISSNPEYYGFITKSYRQIRINRFPYLIIYEVFTDKVVVFSVKHAKQRNEL